MVTSLAQALTMDTIQYSLQSTYKAPPDNLIQSTFERQIKMNFSYWFRFIFIASQILLAFHFIRDAYDDWNANPTVTSGT